MKSYGRNRLPKAPPIRQHRLKSPRATSLDRTRTMLSEHERRESDDKPFDPHQRSSWRGRPGELVVNRGRMRKNPVSERDLEEFMQGYLVCMLWSSTDESNEAGGDPLDDNYSISDIDDESFREAREVCTQFLAECGHAIESATLKRQSEYDKMGAAGHDFWLNRNGHGSGFWDGDWSEPEATELDGCSKKFGEAHPYVSDGKVHVDDDHIIHGRMKQNPDLDDVPRNMTLVEFRYHDAPERNGQSVRYSSFQNGSADEGLDQWYEVDGAGGSDQGGMANKSNYNVLESMLEKAHPSGDEPAVWATAYGGMGTFAILVVWDRLDADIKEAIGSLDEYPVLDDSEYSKLENEAQEEAWKDWGRREFEKEFLSSLNAELSEEDEINDLDDFGDLESYEMFRIGSNVSNEYWEQDSDGSMFIRMKPIVKAVVDILVGRDTQSWVDPDQRNELQELRDKLGIEVK